MEKSKNEGNMALKKSEVVMMSEIEIVFNRNKAMENLTIKKAKLKQSTEIIHKN